MLWSEAQYINNNYNNNKNKKHSDLTLYTKFINTIVSIQLDNELLRLEQNKKLVKINNNNVKTLLYIIRLLPDTFEYL